MFTVHADMSTFIELHTLALLKLLYVTHTPINPFLKVKNNCIIYLAQPHCGPMPRQIIAFWQHLHNLQISRTVCLCWGGWWAQREEKRLCHRGGTIFVLLLEI